MKITRWNKVNKVFSCVLTYEDVRKIFVYLPSLLKHEKRGELYYALVDNEKRKQRKNAKLNKNNYNYIRDEIDKKFTLDEKFPEIIHLFEKHLKRLILKKSKIKS